MQEAEFFSTKPIARSVISTNICIIFFSHGLCKNAIQYQEWNVKMSALLFGLDWRYAFG